MIPTLLLFGLLGCPKPPVSSVDPDLPEEGEPIPAVEALEILKREASNPQPGLRAEALAYLIAGSAQVAGGEWGKRALWDPDAWVQRRGALALLQRAEPASMDALDAWITRPTADAYARGFVAVRMLDRGPTLLPAVQSALSVESSPWRSAPLALAALLLGDPNAASPLIAALSRGNVALEPSFIEDLASGDPELLADSLREGADWVEEELALSYAAARLRFGDRGGEQLLRRALEADTIGERLEAVSLLATLDEAGALGLLRRARSSPFPLVAAHAELALAAKVGAPLKPFDTLSTPADPELRATRITRIAERLASEPSLPKKDRRSLLNALDRGLTDPHSAVRRQALLAIRTLELDPDAARPLLTDPDAANRLHAAGLLYTGASSALPPSHIK